MKYFITGATGFIGGRVAQQLREAGHEVVALVRDPVKAKSLADLGVTLCKGDVTDKESMRAPMAGTDGLFHIAGWYKIGVRDKSEATAINVDGTRNVLELMQELGVPKGVYTSTLGVNEDTGGKLVDETYSYSGPFYSEYTRTKAEAHRLADTFVADGLPLVIVMPGLVYGPGDTSPVKDTLRQYLQHKLPVIPRQTAYCWAHIDDMARAHILAMENGKPGQTYIIAGPMHTLEDAMRIAEQLTGIPAPRTASPEMFKAMSVVMGLIEKITPVPETYTQESLRSIAGVTYIGDNSKARHELGYNPRSLREGLTETLRHEMNILGMSE